MLTERRAYGCQQGLQFFHQLHTKAQISWHTTLTTAVTLLTLVSDKTPEIIYLLYTVNQNNNEIPLKHVSNFQIIILFYFGNTLF